MTRPLKPTIGKNTRYKNEAIVLMNGAIIMIVELVAARIITPYVGSSSFVWTAIIGVMLGALAAGYAWGGRLADNTKASIGLSNILFYASLLVLGATAVYPTVLDSLSRQFGDVRIVSVLGSFILFAPSAFFMGSISPYVATRSAANAKRTEAGQRIGSIYAYGTAGSIVGTFLCGFWLTSYFTNASILVGVAIVLLLLSLFENHDVVALIKKIGVFLFTVAIVSQAGGSFLTGVLYEKDTPYSSYAVFDTQLKNGPVRVLATDRFAWQTGVSISEPQKPAFDYIRAFDDVITSKKDTQRVLLLGGGAFSLTTVAAPKHPTIQFDVVEIDPELTKISAQFFGRIDMPNVHIFNTDARVFIQETKSLYDIVLVDVFSSLRPPFHLTTQEFARATKSRLSEDGIIAINVIGSFAARDARFPAAQKATYESVFSRVDFYAVTPGIDEQDKQNMLMIAANTQDRHLPESYVSTEVTQAGDVLTDAFAPVDRLMGN